MTRHNTFANSEGKKFSVTTYTRVPLKGLIIGSIFAGIGIGIAATFGYEQGERDTIDSFMSLKEVDK